MPQKFEALEFGQFILLTEGDTVFYKGSEWTAYVEAKVASKPEKGSVMVKLSKPYRMSGNNTITEGTPVVARPGEIYQTITH